MLSATDTYNKAGYETALDDERLAWIDQAGKGYGMSMENLKAELVGRSLAC
jgi:hypothetical protein